MIALLNATTPLSRYASVDASEGGVADNIDTANKVCVGSVSVQCEKQATPIRIAPAVCYYQLPVW